MRNLAVLALLGAASVCRAADLANLPPNAWVEIKYTTEQPGAQPDDKGEWRPVGWNKLVYDANGKRVLFYDRWVDKKHGGLTIYGNCLLAFDPAAATVKPIKIDNWTVRRPEKGGYPLKDVWHEIKPANPIPPHKGWFGWMKLCYDSQHDCFIGMIGDKLYAFHHEPVK